MMHDGYCECSTGNVDLFSTPPTQTSDMKHTAVEYHPISNVGDDGPIGFYIPDKDHLVLSSHTLELRCKIVEGDGTDIPADGRWCVRICHLPTTRHVFPSECIRMRNSYQSHHTLIRRRPISKNYSATFRMQKSRSLVVSCTRGTRLAKWMLLTISIKASRNDRHSPNRVKLSL